MKSEMIPILEKSEQGLLQKKFPQPLDLWWRLLHGTAYIIGGVTFFFGSLDYFPSMADYVAGGWLFTVGSAAFLFADAFEWWTNNRVGCFSYEEYEESFEAEIGRYMDPKETCSGKYQRAENGINFATSMTGSFLYLLGSILFIPALNTIYYGTQIFIYGSLVIVIAQTWKLYRAALVNASDPHDKTFRVSNWNNDLPAFLVDFFAGLGGFNYFIGSILFLPAYDVNDDDTYRAAEWFLAGGTAFTLSGIAMWYRYFLTENYPH